MKKPLLTVLFSSLVLTSCIIVPGGNKTTEPGSNDTAQSGSSNSGSSSTTQTTSGTTGSTGTSTDTSSSSSGDVPPPVVEKTTIGAIKANPVQDKVVQFDATLLTTLVWARSNKDLMYFADASNTIWLKLDYGNYTEHLQKLYTMKEYTVTGKTNIQSDGTVEILYDTSYTDRQTVVSLGDSYPISYNANTTPISVANIAEIKAKSALITLNDKYYGAGQLVKFTSQVVQTEKNDANKKAMVLDSDGNTITVVSSKKLVGTDDWGKYYTFIGIISFELSIPAIWGISCSYDSSHSSEEGIINVSNAQTIAPSTFKNYNLTSSYMTPAPQEYYFQLFKATGYVKDNTDITGSYNLGMVDNYSGTNSSLSDQSTNKSVAGFYILDCQKLSESDMNNCPFKNYYDENILVTVYFSIRMFDTTNHLWKMMVIENKIEAAS